MDFIMTLMKALLEAGSNLTRLLDQLCGYVFGCYAKQHMDGDPAANTAGCCCLDAEPAKNDEEETEIWDPEVNQMPYQSKVKDISFLGYKIPVYRINRKRCQLFYIRFRKDGFNIYVTSRDVDELKKKFTDAYEYQRKHPEERKKEETPTTPNTFTAFAEYYFSIFKTEKENSAERIMSDRSRLKNYLEPYFKETTLTKIDPGMCKALLDRLENEKTPKTAMAVRNLLNQILNAAINFNLIQSNPLKMIPVHKVESVHGKALTKKEERDLLLKAEEPLRTMLAIMLYTGQRPNELKHSRIEGRMIVTKNSKRKKGITEEKRIPINPMLQPFLDGVSELQFYDENKLRYGFHKILPDHRLYDLRTTFYTRCQEYGVSEVARNLMVGHTLKGLASTYTDLSDDYLISEAQKLHYDLPAED